MLDLDTIERIPPYEVKHNGKVLTFDTITLVAALAKDAKDNDGKDSNPTHLAARMSQIFGVSLTSQEAMELMKDFGEFAEKYDAKLKELFGVQTTAATATTEIKTSSEQSTQDKISNSVSESTTTKAVAA